MSKIEKVKYEELYNELFDLNYKIVLVCLLVGGGFWILRFKTLGEQCFILALFWAELQGLRRIHREYVQPREYYSSSELRPSFICTKVLYKGNQISVDRGIRISTWIFVCCFLGGTLLLWIGLVCKKNIEGIPISIVFFSCIPSICVIWGNLFHMAHKKFKRLTWKNCRYYMGIIKAGERFPQQYKLGECEIVKRNSIFFKKYYTVNMIKTKHTYKKIIYCGKDKINTDFTYCLYEICGVKYMQ